MSEDLEPKTYEEQRQEMRARQASMSREQIIDEIGANGGISLDLNNLPPQTHHWVDRGTHQSCEGAGHETHKAYYRR